MISDFVEPNEFPKTIQEWQIWFIDNVERDFKKINKEFNTEYEFYFIEVKSMDELAKELAKFDKNDTVIFNWCEEIPGQINTSHDVAKFLENNKYIFTGGDSKCLEINVKKELTKKLLKDAKVNSPQYFILENDKDLKIPGNTIFPVILKSAEDHGSLGISDDSVAENKEELEEKILNYFRFNKRKLLVEQYIAGTEYVVVILGNNAEEILPLQKIVCAYKNKYEIYTDAAKTKPGTEEYDLIYPEIVIDIDSTLQAKIIDEAKFAYKTLGCLGYARIELKVQDNKAYVIDANPNSELDGEFMEAVYSAGFNDGEFLLKTCEYAVEHWTKKMISSYLSFEN